MRIESVENAIEHYVYDLSLPIEERKEKRMTFRSGTAAANWLGVTGKRVSANKQLGFRIWSPRHEKWFAVRTGQSKTIKQ